MKFEEGRVLKSIEIDGKEVVLRFPKKDDVNKFLDYINILIEEKTMILMMEKITLEEEREWLEGTIKGIENDIKIMIMIEIDNQVIANATVQRIAKRRNANEHIGNFGVAIRKEYRRKGLGKLLLEMLIEMAKKEWKIELAQLSVYDSNKPARELYNILGFKEVGRIPKGVKFYNKYMDEIIMIKELKK